MILQKTNVNGSATHFLYLILFLYTVLGAAPVKGQEGSKHNKSRLIAKLPFRVMAGGVIVLQAKVGTSPNLNFILDTGCGGISLDSATVEELKLTTAESNQTIKGLSLLKQARFVMDENLQLSNLIVRNLNFHINDYQFLSGTYGVYINGVIGYAVLKRYIVKVNYDNSTLELWQPGTIRYPKKGYVMKPDINMLPVVSAYINDSRPVSTGYVFDTGADVCFLLSNKFAKDSSIVAANKKIFKVQGEGLGGAKEMQYTTVGEMRVGPYTFSKVPTHIFEDKYNVTGYPQTGGIIGSEILRRFNLIINYPAKEIHLKPNSHFRDPFNYQYTGFRLYNVDGKSIIEDVVKGSPAEKAGLQSGDLLFGINDNFSNNLSDYKRVISKASNELKVSVLRDNQVKTFVVPVQSIL